jgi:hypothetical protein
MQFSKGAKHELFMQDLELVSICPQTDQTDHLEKEYNTDHKE